MFKVKICGITNIGDALEAVRLGADALGFVFAPSPRKVEPLKAKQIINKLPPWISVVGVFVDEQIEYIQKIVQQAGLDWVQLHGKETPEYCRALGGKQIKAFRVKDSSSLGLIREYPCAGILLDAYDSSVLGLPSRRGVPPRMGGTGKLFDWDLAVTAKQFGKPIILAGGLTPENIKEAVEKVNPYGVDVSSGVEINPGKKDYKKLERFITAVKSQKS